MEATPVALLCRTSDRTAGGARGAAALATLIGERVGRPARMVGSPAEPCVGVWHEDLEAGRGCLLEAGGQVEDALGAGRFPVLCASDCSICLTTLPTVARLVPGVLVLWLDAHADFNTPRTTRSRFLGGMCLAGACGRWASGFGGALDPANVIIVGARDVEAGESAELDLAGVTRLVRFADVVDAVDGRDVYVHLDVDVLDPDLVPAQFSAPGGLSDDGLRRLLDEVRQAADRVVGLEVTSFDAPEDATRAAQLTKLVADAAMPLLK
ncbi:MAG: arginase [Solirubrobacteraceae bacterium]|jgi:arginase family enzyme|nr:arginase [Solirubrobacteraceae bacterium]